MGVTLGAPSSRASNVPSKRIGELVPSMVPKLLSDGFLALVPGVVVNGAIDYPIWASSPFNAQFILGDDIVFPDDVLGMFIRNAGGDAAAEGVFQDDATAVNGLSGTSIDLSRATTSSVNGSGNGQRNFGARTDVRDITLNSVDNETRSKNRAYPHYTIVDNY